MILVILMKKKMNQANYLKNQILLHKSKTQATKCSMATSEQSFIIKECSHMDAQVTKKLSLNFLKSKKANIDL